MSTLAFPGDLSQGIAWKESIHRDEIFSEPRLSLSFSIPPGFRALKDQEVKAPGFSSQKCPVLTEMVHAR